MFAVEPDEKDKKTVREWILETLKEKGPLHYEELWELTHQKPEFKQIRGWSPQYFIMTIWCMVNGKEDGLTFTDDRKLTIGPAFLFE